MSTKVPNVKTLGNSDEKTQSHNTHSHAGIGCCAFAACSATRTASSANSAATNCVRRAVVKKKMILDGCRFAACCCKCDSTTARHASS